MARVEYAKAEGTRTSAQSKEANFEQTNLAIADFAQSLANADRETLILVGRGMGISEERLQAIECVAHDSYASAEMNEEIDQVINAVTLSLGPTAKGELTKRIAWRLLPGLSAESRQVIESEIDDEILQAEQDEAMAREHIEAASDANEDEERLVANG
jgi:hypothetical protein